MKLNKQYTPDIIKHNHEDVSKFFGNNKQTVGYILGISPYAPSEPEFLYFNVTVCIKFINDNYGEVFTLDVMTTFKVLHNNQTPSSEFFFDLIEKAGFQAAQIFHEKIQNTNLLHHKTPRPVLSDLEASIQNCIDTWGKTVRGTNLN